MLKRIRHLGLLSIILGIAVLGVLYAFGAREVLHAETESLIGEDETYSVSSPVYIQTYALKRWRAFQCFP